MSLRTASSLTFRKPGGGMETRLFQAPVNVPVAAGGFQAVDATLEKVADGTAHTIATRYDLSLPQDLRSAVQVSDGSNGVSFLLHDAQGARALSGAAATYKSVMRDVDVKYTAGPSALKEDLILAGADASRSFVFDLDPTKGLTPKVNAGGGVDFVDDRGAVKGVIAAPRMTDAKGAESRAVSYSLRRADSGSGWVLTVDADSKWLDSVDRAWPVDVDPSVTFADATDTYIANGNDPPNGEDAQYGPDTVFTVNTNGDRLRRGLIKFSVAGIPKNAVVEGATMHLHTNGQAGSNWPIEAHKLTHDFNQDATWNRYDGTTAWPTPGGDFEPQAQDTTTVGADGWYTWSIGNAVQDWIDGTSANDGLLLKAPVEAVTQPGGGQGASFYGELNGSSVPYLDVNWEYPTGILPQWTFDTYQLTDRSSLKVNVASGDYTYLAQDVHVPGVGGMDLDLSRSYDMQSGWGDDFGYKWLLNAGNGIWVSNYNNGATAIFHGPGDTYWRFRKHYTASGNWDGNYDSPAGVDVTLRDVSGGRTLTYNDTQQKWFFDDSHNDNLTWMEDRNGHRTTFNYGTGPVVNGYDPTQHIASVTDTQGRSYTVNRSSTTPNHEVTSITDASYPGGTRTWSYGYTQYGSDPTFQLLTSYTDPAGKTTSYDYGSGSTIRKITDPRGNQTLIDIDPDADGLYRVTSVTRVTDAVNQTGPTTLYCYDVANRKTTVYDPDGTGGSVPGISQCSNPTASELAHRTVYTYDDKGQVTKTTNALGQDTTTTYNNMGDVTSEIEQAGSGGAAPSTYNYDADGNLTSETDAVDTTHTTQATTDFDPGTGVTGHKYLPTASTDETGDERSYAYDTAGNITAVSTTGLADKTDMTYTDGTETGAPPVGLLKTSTDANNSTTNYTYYGAADGTRTGDLKKVSPPTVTRGSSTYRPGEQTYTYDAESRIATTTDAKGTVTTYGYDKLDRRTTVSTPSKTYTYSYDNNGNLTGRTDGTTSSSYTFDALNRRTAETVAASSKNYGYDDNSNITSLTDSWGSTSYTYFPDNRVKTITDPASQTVSYAYSDTSSPRRTTITYPNATGALTTSNDMSGKVVSIDAKTTGSTERKLTYTYLPNTATTPNTSGELIGTESEYQNGSTTAATIWKYRYDGLMRLCAATTGTLPAACPAAGSAGTAGVYGYLYDKASNRIVRWNGTTVTTYAYDAASELCWSYTGTAFSACASPPTGATAYTYDADGDRTTGNLTYDAFKRQSGIGASNLAFLSSDNSELVTDGSTTLSNSLLGVDSTTAGGARTDYIRDPDGEEVGEHTSSGTRYITADSRGSTRWVWSGGSVDRTYAYTPDGGVLGAGPGTDTKMLFEGGYLAGGSTSTPLYHFGARFYDASTAQWTQQDPLANTTGNLRDVNIYGFAGQDPVNYGDLTGEFWNPFSKLKKAVLRFVEKNAHRIGHLALKYGEKCANAVADVVVSIPRVHVGAALKVVAYCGADIVFEA